MRWSKFKYIAFFLIISFAVALFPIQLVMVPKRTLMVVDSHQKPLNGVLVRQIWDQYSLHIHGEEDFVTSEEGQVILPERVVDTNLVTLVSGAAANIAQLSIHASLGSHENIGLMKDGYPTIWFYSSGKPLESDVVIMRD